MSHGWDDARKAKQAEAIHRWKPWKKATGPKTAEGKKAVSMNSLRHGRRSAAFAAERAALMKILRELGQPRC